MAKTYNSIPTVSTGDVYTATAHNNIVTNVNNYRVPPMCVVRRTTDVNPYTSYGVISWTDALHDTDGMFSAAAPTKVTVQTSGVYSVAFHVYLTGAATITGGESFVSLNGTAILDQQNTGYGTTGLMFDHSGIIVCSAGGEITAGTGVTGGSAYILKGSSTYGLLQTRLSVMWLGQVS